MKKLLILFIALSSVAEAQTPVGIFRRYPQIAVGDILTGTTAFTAASATCCGPGIMQPPASHKAKGSGDFPNGFSMRQWDGDVSNWYYLQNTASEVYGGVPPTSQEGISVTNHANYVKIQGVSISYPMRIRGNNGIQIPAGTLASGGAHWEVTNVVIANNGGAGITANFDTSLGSYYSSEVIRFCRGLNLGQEFYYGGATHPGYAEHGSLTFTQNFCYNTFRNGPQWEHYDHVVAKWNTFILTGIGNEGDDQVAALQAHDLGAGSEIAYNIYDRSNIAFNIFCHGLNVHDNLFIYSGNPSFIGDYTTNYLSASTRFTGDTLFIQGNKIGYTGADSADLVVIAERLCPIVFRNNTFGGKIKARIYSDARSTPHPYAIIGAIGNNGNTRGTVDSPTYVTGYNDPDQPDTHGLQRTSSPYWAQGWGYRAYGTH